MRVFPIVIPIGRQIMSDQELYVGDKEKGLRHILPAGCGVIVNITALHYNTNYWPQPGVLEPQRWLSSSPNTYDPAGTKQGGDEETAVQHPIPGQNKGTFFTFSEGPRACMGKRFATTELIAFFARLLRHYRIQLGPDVSAEEVDRTIRCRSGGSPVTLVPPEDVKLILVRRN
jgi:cytochrome P450